MPGKTYTWSLLALLALALILATAGTEAQATRPSAVEALSAALAAYNQLHDAQYRMDTTEQSGSLAYAWASDGMNELVLLAQELPGQGWDVLTPGTAPAADYNRLLAQFPDTIFDPATKAYLRLQEPDQLSAQSLSILANFSGHKLPYQANDLGLVTQKDLSHDNASHLNQIDFVIYDSGYTTRSRPVVATKPGTVVFVKDSSNENCTTSYYNGVPCWKWSNMVVVQHSSSEYTWYVHVAYKSAVVKVGQYVPYGAKLAVQGNTGYSSGTHLHFMASDVKPASWPDPNNPADAPWPANRVPVDFLESSWANLQVGSWYKSQNINSPFPCPATGGVILYRNDSSGCAAMPEGSGYFLRTVSGFANVPAGMNDAASSIVVPSGWSLRLYEHASRGGASRCIEAPGLPSFIGEKYKDSDISLNDTVSSIEVFPTTGCPASPLFDTTPPTGSFSSPASGVTVGQLALLSAAASDSGSGVAEVRFSARWGSQPWRRIYTGSASPASYSWDLCADNVPDGPVELALEIRDQAGNIFQPAGMTVNKSYDCALPERASQPPPMETCEAGQWCAETWTNTTLEGEPAARRNAGETLDLNWGSGGVHPALPADNFSTRFTRQAAFPCGTYQFSALGDDSLRVWLDNVEQIPVGGVFSADLSTGLHQLKVEQVETTGDASVHLSWLETSRCPVTTTLSPASAAFTVRGGTVVEPLLTAQVSAGFLDPARGDALVNTSQLLGAGSPQLVRQFTGSGASYPIDSLNHPSFRLTAPATGGPYISKWQLQVGGSPVAASDLTLTVDNTLPQISFDALPAATNASSVQLTANVSDTNGLSHVQFFVGYKATSSSTWAWQPLIVLTTPTSGDQWKVTWNIPSTVPDQADIQFFAYAWDRAGNYNGALTSKLMLDRTLPSASFLNLAAAQDSTRFLVQWTGSDNLSGIKNFSLQVKQDSGSWATWKAQIPASIRQDWYTGALNSAYTFQIRVEDNAGNVRDFSTTSQAATFVNPCTLDQYEANDSAAAATPVMVGAPPLPLNICVVGDQDWFKFDVLAGKEYMLYTSDGGPAAGTRVDLFQSGDMVNPYQTISGIPATLTWTVNSNATYYARVQHVDPLVAGNAASYALGVAETKRHYLPIVSR